MAAKKLKLNKTVVSHLRDAVTAAQTVLDACRAAAKVAVKELDGSLGLDGAINKVVNDYSTEFGGNHNVRANFKKALTLLAGRDEPLSFEHNGVEYHTTHAQAVDLPKHAMDAAVKAAREDMGLARKAGGGRKPKQPTANQAPKVGAISGAPLASPTTQKAGMVNSLTSHSLKELVTELRERISDNTQAASVLLAMLKAEGYVVYKRK